MNIRIGGWGRGLIALAGVAAMATAVRSFGPDSAWVGPWTSDAAIPLLMSNLERLSRFELYYWGQDRFGALPFLVASVWHRFTGFVWTPERGSVALIVFTLASAWPLSRLLRPAGFWVVAWWALLLASPWHYVLFDLCQPYGWQMTLVLWSWWALRRVREAPDFGRVAIAVCLCTLATWVAGTSLVPLFAIAIAEGLAASRPHTWRRWALLLGTPLGAALLELWIRRTHRYYAIRHFGHGYRSSLRLEPGGIPHALELAWKELERGGARWFLVFVVLGGAAVLVRLFLRRRQGDSTALHPNEVAILGIAGLSSGYVLMLASVGHFQENGLAEKYFTPIGLLAVAGVALMVERLFAILFQDGGPMLERVGMPLISAGLVSAWIWTPLPPRQPAFALERRIAETLAARAPGAFLTTGYWHTFELAALAPPGALRPYAHDGQYRRTPFLERDLRSASWVWVGDAGASDQPLPDVTHPLLMVGGALLERRPEPMTVVEGRRFVPFRAAPQLSGSPPTAKLNTCPREWSTTFAPAAGARLAVAANYGASLPEQLEAWGIAADSGARVPLHLAARQPRVHVWEPASDVVLQGFGLHWPSLQEGKGCPADKAFILAPAEPVVDAPATP